MILTVYLSGVLFSLVVQAVDVYISGVATLLDMLLIALVAMLSWLVVCLLLVQVCKNTLNRLDRIIIWKKK